MTPAALSYIVAPLALPQPPEIGPPLAGNRWVAFNDAAKPRSLPVERPADNGSFTMADFAIDWMRLDDAGVCAWRRRRRAHCACYGADCSHCRRDGGGVLDALGDQPPGKLPDPKTMTLEMRLTITPSSIWEPACTRSTPTWKGSLA